MTRVCRYAWDDERPPFAYVHVTGTAEAISGAPDLLDWATRIAARYVGDQIAPEYGERNAVESELLGRMSPSRVLALTGISDRRLSLGLN